VRPTPLLIAVVTLGGASGTALRYAVTQLLPTTHLIPWATLCVNVIGAFLLGLLLERLARSGAETPRRTLARLGLGTGLLGGLTTYSALAVEVQDLLGRGEFSAGLGYGLGSVAAGLASVGLGIVVAGHGRARS
jgi:CrcB protein